jgi:hypothetical protein
VFRVRVRVDKLKTVRKGRREHNMAQDIHIHITSTNVQTASQQQIGQTDRQTAPHDKHSRMDKARKTKMKKKNKSVSSKSLQIKYNYDT